MDTKEFNKDGMPVFNLVKEYNKPCKPFWDWKTSSEIDYGTKRNQFLAQLKEKSYYLDKDPLGKFNVGDIIELTGGMENGMRYIAEIGGFSKGDEFADRYIHLLWDSYWAGVRDDRIRNITLVEKAENVD